MDKNQFQVSQLQDQIMDLKAELVELSAGLSARVEDVQQAAKPSIGVIKDNPGTISTIAVSAGLLGIAIGYIVGSSNSSAASRWHL